MPKKTVLVIGDCHIPAVLTKPSYFKFLERVAEEWETNHTVVIGDLVDWQALNFHEKHPGASSPAEEFARAKRMVAQLHDIFPKKVDWLLGNRASLTYRQAAKVGICEEWLVDPLALFELKDWKVHPRYSTVEIDDVLYSHGEVGPGGQFASVKQSRANFQSTVIGHWHSEAGVWYTANENHLTFGMNVGTGCDRHSLAFDYGRKFVRKPIVSCGVVLKGRVAHLIPMDMPGKRNGTE